jgi:NAD+ kinase
MKIAITANITKEGIKTIIPLFLDLLKDEGIDFSLHKSLKAIFGDTFCYPDDDKLFDNADFIVSFGGDGTILNTVQLSRGESIPILGVNLGKVGFLAEVSPEEISTIPKKLKNGDYEIIERMAFYATTSSGEKYYALNDIVLDRNANTRILELSISIEDIIAGDFAADGIIISTPTGSTAHSVSAGGPLVMPECNVIILTPICPHSLTLRPMVIDGSKSVSINVLNGLARMAVDGQSFVNFPAGCIVTIKKAENSVKIARFKDKTYFDILHKRLIGV